MKKGRVGNIETPMIATAVTASMARSRATAMPLAVTSIQDALRKAIRGNGRGVDEGDVMYTLLTGSTHAVAFHAKQDPISAREVSLPLSHEHGSLGVVCFDEAQITHPENRNNPRASDPSPSLTKASRVDVCGSTRPRRLTPREWERLQGFPDGYTAIAVGRRGQIARDSPRYEALGNSMAVPVMRWIGRRLQAVDAIVVQVRA